jgi:hypothetical protein
VFTANIRGQTIRGVPPGFWDRIICWLLCSCRNMLPPDLRNVPMTHLL